MREDWQPEPRLEVDVGFEAAVGPDGFRALVERVAMWGHRLPRTGDHVFIQAATVAIDGAGLDPRECAASILQLGMERVGVAIDPPGDIAVLLTADASVAPVI